ncbi:MULE domain-containing protein [Mycena venus]|uniref:MULE domain-containing protein n=1 Tax=Mycena venus TaxID=2733690 RepID=A0A8H6YAG3_9AGAR|nr:MULE domain-containing protein [Mycena venus]
MESFDALAKRKITVLQNFKYLVWGAMTAVTAFSFHPTMSFALYGTPTPDTLFSAESFHDITIADADRIIQGGQLPHILPKGSLRAWVFDREVPTSLEELTVSANEHIPCAEDMLPITREMESAFHRGARSVCLNLPNGSVRYHLSKIRLIINVNNHAANLAAAASLLNHVESSFLLLPDRIQELKGNKFMEPLAGFHVTAIPLYTLGCLLNERWAKEDVLNARAELTYFHRAVIKDLGQDPSFLFIPTSFINDCRTLIKLPGSPYSQNIIWFRERVRSGSVNVIGFLSWTRDHYSALVKMRVDDLEHGDSLNLPPESDLLPLLRWALAGLRDFESRADQTYIPSGLIDRQTSLAGEGSCGIAAANFIEFRIGMDIPRWMADQSADFRDLFLQEMLLYHLIARCKTTQYSDWVMPCFLSGNGEVPGFTSTDVGVGYCDFNLDMPSPDTPPPLTRTIPQRQVYAALQADFRAMVNGIQTQEQLDETRARIEQVNYQAQEDANQGRVRDPPTMTRKEREVELYWSEDRLTLADQPDVYLEFPRFLEDVVKWVADRRTRQTNRASNAMALVRTSSDIFAGAGVYTITELWHMAGLSPNLTEAEVFDSPSRTARLCGAFYHFAKEAHTTLWTLVQRFLVDYVICVRKENRLLYSERLQVYGKERSYVSARFHGLLVNFKAVCEVHSRDPLWVRRCTAAGPFDVFEPELIRHALEFEDINLGGLIFGEELWAKLHSDAGLPIACLSSDNTLARFYSNLSIAPEMSTSWLNPTAYTYLFHANKGALRASHPLTILYRAANTDIWSVIPVFPDNSAPIPRARPPQVPKSEQIGDLVAPATWKSGKPPKPKTVAPLVPKTTPMQQCNPSTRDRALLAYIIKFTQNFTVGPLDYCGIARRIKGRGDDM